MNDLLDATRCAELLGALAAPDRLRIVQLLRAGPRNVGEIAADLKVSIVNVSHHLGVLRHANLVHHEKSGRYMFYSLTPSVLHNSEGKFLNLGCCRQRQNNLTKDHSDPFDRKHCLG
jgi:DNA-binding transcriptional ArsR family regulator